MTISPELLAIAIITFCVVIVLLYENSRNAKRLADSIPPQVADTLKEITLEVLLLAATKTETKADDEYVKRLEKQWGSLSQREEPEEPVEPVDGTIRE